MKTRLFMALLLLTVSAAALSFSDSTTYSYCSQTGAPGGGPGVIYGTAPWYCQQANQAIAKQWASWEPLALIAVFFSFSLATVMFLAAQILNNSKVRNFAIGEYYEAIATAIIVTGFLFLTAVIVGLMPSLIIGANPYVTSLNYISNTISSTQSMLSILFNIYVTDSQLVTSHIAFCTGPPLSSPIGSGSGAASITGGSGAGTIEAPPVLAAGSSTASTVSSTTPSAQIGGITPCIGSSDVADFLEPAVTVLFILPAQVYMNLQTDALALLYGEFYLIMILMYAAIPVFLIPGIILRAILPLRGLGGMMIAIAIGTYIIMPTLFAVSYYFTNPELQSQVQSATTALAQYGNGPGAQLNAATPQSPLPQTLNLLQQGLGAYWMAVLFYPVLIFAITYAMIVQIAQFLGNMTSMSSKFKII